MRISDWSSDVCSSDLYSLNPLAAVFYPSHAPRPLSAGHSPELRSPHSPRRLSGGRAGHHRALRLPAGRPPPEAGRARLPFPGRGAAAPELGGLPGSPAGRPRKLGREIGRAPVWTPVPHAHLVCHLLLAKTTRRTDST